MSVLPPLSEFCSTILGGNDHRNSAPHSVEGVFVDPKELARYYTDSRSTERYVVIRGFAPGIYDRCGAIEQTVGLDGALLFCAPDDNKAVDAWGEFLRLPGRVVALNFMDRVARKKFIRAALHCVDSPNLWGLLDVLTAVRSRSVETPTGTPKRPASATLHRPTPSPTVRSELSAVLQRSLWQAPGEGWVPPNLYTPPDKYGADWKDVVSVPGLEWPNDDPDESDGRDASAWYVVWKGRTVGIFKHRILAQQAVRGFDKASAGLEGFDHYSSALEFYLAKRDNGELKIPANA